MNALGKLKMPACILVMMGALIGYAMAQSSGMQNASPDDPPGLQALKAAGRDASLSVYPAGLIGKPMRQVGDVVALMLERGGMKNLEIDAPEFTPPDKADLTQMAAAFGDFVRANPPATDYALFADFKGSHAKGFEEVRAVIVNRKGEVAWQDAQARKDADFRRIKPKEPMQCCLLVVERLRPVLGLTDPHGDSAHEGKIARHWAERSGLPEKAEQEAMQARRIDFKKAAATASLVIYPVHAGDALSRESAVDLAKWINDDNLMNAVASAEGPQLTVKGNMNEQRVLWEMARGVREYVKAHRPDSDYVLYADYLMGKDVSGKAIVGGVHFVVCDREGQWVIADFQNNHHADFNAINPKSREDCDRLVAKRLKGYCR